MEQCIKIITVCSHWNQKMKKNIESKDFYKAPNGDIESWTENIKYVILTFSLCEAAFSYK